jgi:hypothetical protein
VRPVVFSGRDHSQHRVPHCLRGIEARIGLKFGKAPVTSLTVEAESTAHRDANYPAKPPALPERIEAVLRLRE